MKISELYIGATVSISAADFESQSISLFLNRVSETEGAYLLSLKLSFGVLNGEIAPRSEEKPEGISYIGVTARVEFPKCLVSDAWVQKTLSERALWWDEHPGAKGEVLKEAPAIWLESGPGSLYQFELSQEVSGESKYLKMDNPYWENFTWCGKGSQKCTQFGAKRPIISA